MGKYLIKQYGDEQVLSRLKRREKRNATGHTCKGTK